jgi:hypothetical protein
MIRNDDDQVLLRRAGFSKRAQNGFGPPERVSA